VRHAIIVRTKKETRRPDGRYIRFDDNAGVLLNNKVSMPSHEKCCLFIQLISFPTARTHGHENQRRCSCRTSTKRVEQNMQSSSQGCMIWLDFSMSSLYVYPLLLTRIPDTMLFYRLIQQTFHYQEPLPLMQRIRNLVILVT
jgi:hypothetical protein